MTTDEIWRPAEGDDKDPIVRPCPYCGKRVPNEVVHQLEQGSFPEGFVRCPTRGCSGELHIYHDKPVFRLEWK